MPDLGIPATFDAVSGSLSGAHVRGATTLTLAGAVAVVKGRLYLVEDTTSGDVIVVEAAKSGSLASIPLREPLPRSFVTASTFKGWACLFSLTVTHTRDVGRCVAVWECTALGATQRWSQDFRIVRRMIAWQLTATDLVSLSPYATQLQPPDDTDWLQTLEGAWSRWVSPVMLAKGIRPERITSWEIVNAWHIAAVELHLALQFERGGDGVVAKSEKMEALRVAEALALNSVRFWLDDGDDLGEQPEAADTVRPWNVTMMTR